jgi:uncharacterized protein (DUF1499 family)
MKKKTKSFFIVGLAMGLCLALLFIPHKHQAEAKIGPSELPLHAHRYNMTPEQTGQFVKAILPKLGWVLMGQDRNVFSARTPGAVFGQNCKVTITVQNTQMGEAAYVEVRSESFQGVSDFGVNAANIHRLQAAMDEKLP